ncbi:MAG: peptide chain release factor N(5)-glutamine methyltransferase [Anaerolineaceae bacterium]|nr:peptide chain release factor N(5)-glutamine methyltransferase [Anaerolineaceae bacterium]
MTISIAEWRYQSFQILHEISDTADIEINAILCFVLKKDLTWVLAHSEFNLDDEIESILRQKLNLLWEGMPLAYVKEEIEFFGLKFYVNSDVLIPRPETEILVELANDWISHHPLIGKIIDVGTGSGAIIISILKQFPEINGIGVDISRIALEIALKNKYLNKILNLDLVQMDCLSGISEKFDLICANLPYIPDGDLDALSVSKYEPKIALAGGVDGLEIIDVLLEQISSRINLPGLVLLEIQNDQALRLFEKVRSVLPEAKLSVNKDYSGNDRVIKIEV